MCKNITVPVGHGVFPLGGAPTPWVRGAANIQQNCLKNCMKLKQFLTPGEVPCPLGPHRSGTASINYLKKICGPMNILIFLFSMPHHIAAGSSTDTGTYREL